MKIISGMLALLGVGVLLAVVLSGGHVAEAEFSPEVAAEAGEPSSDGVPSLLAELAALEPDLPPAPAPTGVELDVTATWGRLEGDAVASRAALDPLEPDLRRLFVAADEADGELADAVALVARGWLDIWSGMQPLAVWERHDLEFPTDTDDADGVATGGDELRGAAERGLEQILVGNRRLAEGYGLLRALGPAEPDLQVRLDVRAADADSFDAEVRPLVLTLLSQSTPTVLVTTDRFGTAAPGSEARARNSTVICVDREALAATEGALSAEQLAQLSAGTPERIDCPRSPAGAIAP